MTNTTPNTTTNRTPTATAFAPRYQERTPLMHPMINEEFWKSPLFMGENLRGSRGQLWPHFDFKETGQAYVIQADVPGINLKDLEIRLIGGRLMVHGSRQIENMEDRDLYHVSERFNGEFDRSITLPEIVNASAVDANLENGVLTLTVVKGEASKAQIVKVKSGH